MVIERHKMVKLPTLVGHCAGDLDHARVGPVAREVKVAVRVEDAGCARKARDIEQFVAGDGCGGIQYENVHVLPPE